MPLFPNGKRNLTVFFLLSELPSTCQNRVPETVDEFESDDVVSGSGFDSVKIIFISKKLDLLPPKKYLAFSGRFSSFISSRIALTTRCFERTISPALRSNKLFSRLADTNRPPNETLSLNCPTADDLSARSIGPTVSKHESYVYFDTRKNAESARLKKICCNAKDFCPVGPTLSKKPVRQSKF